MNGYFYVLGTIVFTVYGQLVLKWRLTQMQIKLPDGIVPKIVVLIKLIFDHYIFSGFLAAFIASLFWMGAMTKFEITKVYPFMSIAPALVFLFGVFLFRESFSWGKVIGLIFIILGSYITTVK